MTSYLAKRRLGLMICNDHVVVLDPEFKFKTHDIDLTHVFVSEINKL